MTDNANSGSRWIASANTSPADSLLTPEGRLVTGSTAGRVFFEMAIFLAMAILVLNFLLGSAQGRADGISFSDFHWASKLGAALLLAIGALMGLLDLVENRKRNAELAALGYASPKSYIHAMEKSK